MVLAHNLIEAVQCQELEEGQVDSWKAMDQLPKAIIQRTHLQQRPDTDLVMISVECPGLNTEIYLP